MCTGLELIPLISGVLGVGSSVVSAASSSPPVPEVPATSADGARSAGATVRVGSGKNDSTSDSTTVSSTGTSETRIFGKPVGGVSNSSRSGTGLSI